MMGGESLLVTLALWGMHLFYLTSFIPQIVINFKLQTSKGLSGVLLFGYLNGYLAFIYYFSCFNYSISHQIWNALQFLAVLILIFQRLYYDSSNNFFKLFFLFLGNMIFATFFLPFAWSNPTLFGNISAWVAAFFFCISQFFQIGKIYTTKSVAGFSFWFVLMMLFGALLELTVVYIASYAFQSRLSLWRFVMGCGIYCFQFLMYRK
ncbi:MAG: PQ-loop repeat-containing protein [bacterium]